MSPVISGWELAKRLAARLEAAEAKLAEATIPSEAAWQEGARMLQEADRARRAAEAEVARLKSCSTVEIMCENPSVDSHVREWEARCLKAEAEVERLRTERAIIDSKLKDTAIGWAQGPILAALQQARDLGREEAQAEVEQLRKALEGMVNCPVGGSGQRLPTPETVARARAALRGEGEK